MTFSSATKTLIATAFAFAALTTAANAYTPEQEQACTGDAMRLCSSEIPDVDRVTACMVQKRAQLSDGCKVMFRDERAAPANYSQAKPSKPLSLTPHKRG